MTGRVVSIVPARLDSRRLARKQFCSLGRHTVLGCLISRLRVAESLDDIVIATTERSVDDDLESFALRAGVPIYRHHGDVGDVVGRLNAAAIAFEAAIVVRANADSPLLAPELVDVAVEQLVAKGAHLVTGKKAYTGLPVGILGDVLSNALLSELDKSLHSASDREHVTATVFKDQPGSVWLPVEFALELPRSNLPALTVDTAQDVRRVRELIGFLSNDNPGSWRVADIMFAAQTIDVDRCEGVPHADRE